MKLQWLDVHTANDIAETACASTLTVISALRDRHGSVSHTEVGGDAHTQAATKEQETSFSVRHMVVGSDASIQAVQNPLLGALVFALRTVGGGDVQSRDVISPHNRLLSIV